MSTTTFDPIWEKKYAQGLAQRYPWDTIVTFVFRQAKRDRPRAETHLLEVGCGTAGNLWFAAREGFRVSGIDGSAEAIEYARRRFAAEGLTGDLRVGDFTQLPWEEKTFDLVIDRGALTCCGRSAAQRAVEEVRRVLKPGGKFFCNPYGDRHTSAHSGQGGADGLITEIQKGSLVGCGQLCFYNEAQARALFGPGWALESFQRLEIQEEIGADTGVHAEWRMIGVRNA